MQLIPRLTNVPFQPITKYNIYFDENLVVWCKKNKKYISHIFYRNTHENKKNNKQKTNVQNVTI